MDEDDDFLEAFAQQRMYEREQWVRNELERVAAIEEERKAQHAADYEAAVQRGEAAPRKEWSQARIKRLLELGMQEFGPHYIDRTGTTRAQFVKRLLDYAQGYEFVELTKPKGCEDICWNELRNPPPGGLANTYLVETVIVFVNLGFREVETVTWKADEFDGIETVTECDSLNLEIRYYDDVNK